MASTFGDTLYYKQLEYIKNLEERLKYYVGLSEVMYYLRDHDIDKYSAIEHEEIKRTRGNLNMELQKQLQILNDIENGYYD
jgi:hypothetical protein